MVIRGNLEEKFVGGWLSSLLLCEREANFSVNCMMHMSSFQPSAGLTE